MEWFQEVDWEAMLLPDRPLLEIIVRGTVVYLSLFLMLRLVLKRQAGTMGMTDLLVIVLIADAAQNGMAGAYQSLPDGLLLVATLIFWNYALEWLGFRYAWVEELINPAPLMLVKNGRLMRRNMQKELITEDDLLSQLRQQGVEDLAQVKQACLEGDGKISVIERRKTHRRRPRASAH